MAHITSDHVQTQFSNPFAGWAKAFFNGLAAIADSNSRMREVERLQAMSDEDLAHRGLKREDIVSHVFREMLYI